MGAAGYTFAVRPSRAVEWPFPGGDPAAHAESLARAKAAGAEGEVVIGADTIVVVAGEVLGKPAGPEDAVRMLERLSGRDHHVITAVAVNHRGHIRWGHARTRVRFRELGDAEVATYIAGGEPLDRAGAYAIQGGGSAFVSELEGDLDTVIGLPIRLLDRLLPEGLRRGIGDQPADRQ